LSAASQHTNDKHSAKLVLNVKITTYVQLKAMLHCIQHLPDGFALLWGEAIAKLMTKVVSSACVQRDASLSSASTYHMDLRSCGVKPPTAAAAADAAASPTAAAV
jgi:hypothetical protein